MHLGGSLKKIKLTKGYETLVDDDMYDYLNQWKWYAHEEGRNERKYIYALRTEKGRTPRMHNEIMGVNFKRVIIDHLDGNGLNNQRENLRIASKVENSINRKSLNTNNTSGHRNITMINGYWRLQLQIDGKNYLFPEKFTDIDEAGAFAVTMRQKYYSKHMKKNE